MNDYSSELKRMSFDELIDESNRLLDRIKNGYYGETIDYELDSIQSEFKRRLLENIHKGEF